MSAKMDKKGAPQATPPVNIHNAADFKSIYVNFVQTAASATDISIGVGETSPTQTDTVDLEMRARLVMAPLQAKIMVGMLIQAIQQYEKQFGEIVIPPAMSAQLSAGVPRTVAVEKGKDSTEGD
jgi:hypothetical protein